MLGNGLLTSDNDFHRRQRRLIGPTFRPRAVASAADTVADYTERLSARWSDGEILDVRREMVRLTLWIVGKSLFGEDVLEEADELGGALTAAIHGFNSQASALIPLTIEWPTPANLGYRKAIRRLERTLNRVLAGRRASDSWTDDWLTMLLRAHDHGGWPMSDRQIRDEALNMFMPATRPRRPG